MDTIRVATWNLSHAVKRGAVRRTAAWRYLAESVRPDIALVQEADGRPIEAQFEEPTADETGVRCTTRVVSYGPSMTPWSCPGFVDGLPHPAAMTGAER
jgi:hypothetical protein